MLIKELCSLDSRHVVLVHELTSTSKHTMKIKRLSGLKGLINIRCDREGLMRTTSQHFHHLPYLRIQQQLCVTVIS